MIDKYIAIETHTLKQYTKELKGNKDISCILYFGNTEELNEYLRKNKNKSLRHTLAYLWRFNKHPYYFSSDKEDIRIVEKLNEKDDPMCVFFKYMFAHMYNIKINGKESNYYYHKCFEVGPHIVQFDEKALGKYAEYDMLEYATKYNYTNWCAWYIFDNFKYDNYHKYFEILTKYMHAGCSASASVYLTYMLNGDFIHDLNEREMYIAALKILNQPYQPDIYLEDEYRGYYAYYTLGNYYMHCYEYSIQTLYNIYLNSQNNNVFRYAPETNLALGICYFSGLGVTQNYQKAFEILSKNTCEFRMVDVYCNFFLGRMYKEGLYVSKNIDKGMDLLFDYYPRAALEKYYYWMENKEYDKLTQHFDFYHPFTSLFIDSFNEYYLWKNVMAQNVGYVYHVIKKDYNKAIEVYNECINSGGCMNNLGHLYEYTLKDLDNAFKSYQKSAEYHDPAGTWNLALCYFYGKGTSININEFKKYHELAKSLNVKEAIDFKY